MIVADLDPCLHRELLMTGELQKTIPRLQALPLLLFLGLRMIALARP